MIGFGNVDPECLVRADQKVEPIDRVEIDLGAQRAIIAQHLLLDASVFSKAEAVSISLDRRR